jgi:hypothetical protein
LQQVDLSSIRVTKPLLRHHFLPALKENIFMQRILGRIPPGIINEELNDNEIIEKEIITCLVKAEITNSLFLSLKNKRSELLKPAIKMIRC